jgi:phosphoglycerate dehydrogenase-like enzyme/glyoxylase-like metal-dependent hydrolase (beta-lactamase superfamily II)
MKKLIVRVFAAAALLVIVGAVAWRQDAEPGRERPVKVGDGIWFQQHTDIGKFGSNVAWIEFDTFVVVVDTAFPLGAEAAIRNIKATTGGKPIRYAIVTHYHADHSFGNGAFAKEGATIIAHENARRDYLARNVKNYEETAKRDPAYARYAPYAPDLTFTESMVLDDGKRRAELIYFGHAHTTGCVFTWLPREKVIFTGDACVNGPFNYMGDSDSASWIEVLGLAQALGPEKVVPGHGPVAGGELLAKQRGYFVELREQVGRLAAEGKTLDEVRKLVDIPMWKEWTGQKQMNADNIAHVYGEVTRGSLNWDGHPGVTAPAVVAIPVEPGKERPRLKFLAGKLPADQLAGLRQVAPNVQIVTASGREEALKLAPEVHGAAANFLSPEFLKAATNLRWVQSFSAGVEEYVAIPELTGNDAIVLTNMKVVFGPNIADHAMAMLLSLVRRLPDYQVQMQLGRWANAVTVAGELKGKTLVVVGLGGIGTEVARRAHGCGMRVLAVDPKEMAVPAYVFRLEKPERLDALLAEADAVAMCAPLTGQSRSMFGSAQFARLKPGAYFINVSRGKTTDTQALIDALASGKLAGAGLDVTDPEPLPPDHPLWRVQNVIITPHMASQSPECAARRRALFTENVRRFGAGEPLLNVVDKKLGY